MSDNQVMPGAAVEAVAKVLEFHLTDAAQDSGCALRCGYDADDMARHLAEHILEGVASRTQTPLIPVDKWAACYVLEGELANELEARP